MKHLLYILCIFFSTHVNAQNTFTAKYEFTNIYAGVLKDETIYKPLKYDGFLFKKNNSIISYTKPLYLKDYPKERIDIPNNRFIALNMDTIQFAQFQNTDSFYTRSYDKTTPFCTFFTFETNIWEISSETKTILGKTCQKATMYYPTPKDVYAIIWFDPKFSIGAVDFFGMKNAPGLIMEAEMPTNFIKYTMTAYQINPPVSDAQMTLKELEVPCTPRRRLGPEQLKANKKRVEILQQVDF